MECTVKIKRTRISQQSYHHIIIFDLRLLKCRLKHVLYLHSTQLLVILLEDIMQHSFSLCVPFNLEPITQ